MSIFSPSNYSQCVLSKANVSMKDVLSFFGGTFAGSFAKRKIVVRVGTETTVKLYLWRRLVETEWGNFWKTFHEKLSVRQEVIKTFVEAFNFKLLKFSMNATPDSRLEFTP